MVKNVFSDDDIIPWGDGYQCLGCGCEFGRNPHVTDEDMGLERDDE